MGLNRQQLLTSRKLRIKAVTVAGLDDVVYVRVMTGTERDRWEERQIDEKFTNFRARFLCSTLCDEDGKLLFSEDDVDAVGSLPMDTLEPLFEEARGLNMLRDADVEKLEKK